MSMSNAQRAILRDMAGGGSLYQQRGSMKYVLFPPGTEDGQRVPRERGDELSRLGMIRRHNAGGGYWIFTITPAGAEAAREGMG